MGREQERIGAAPELAEPTEPCAVLTRTCGYLSNNADRMKYLEYRRAALPVTSSWVESLVKGINLRLRGSEKFRNGGGAERILAVRAAALRDEERLATHLAARPGCPFHRRAAD
jgi:hypothetical protein